MNLAKAPASTIQILGAEKALFRALKTKHDTPKYGLIYHASLVGQATGKNKGKIARVLAAKSAIGSRIDALSEWGAGTEGDADAVPEEEKSAMGIAWRTKIERRLAAMEGKPLKAKGAAIGPNGIPVQPGRWEVKEARKYNKDADGLTGDEPAAAAPKEKASKKEKKKAKIEVVEEDSDSDEDSDEESDEEMKDANGTEEKEDDEDDEEEKEEEEEEEEIALEEAVKPSKNGVPKPPPISTVGIGLNGRSRELSATPSSLSPTAPILRTRRHNKIRTGNPASWETQKRQRRPARRKGIYGSWLSRRTGLRNARIATQRLSEGWLVSSETSRKNRQSRDVMRSLLNGPSKPGCLWSVLSESMPAAN